MGNNIIEKINDFLLELGFITVSMTSTILGTVIIIKATIEDSSNFLWLLYGFIAGLLLIYFGVRVLWFYDEQYQKEVKNKDGK